MSKSIFGYEVHREGEIGKKDVLSAFKFIQSLGALGKAARQRVFFMFGGYDEDNRELYEIEEVRAYVLKLFKKIPYLFYYVDQEMYENQQLLLSCLCDIAVVYEGKKMSPIEMEEAGYTLETIPKHQMIIHMPNKIWSELKAETRKHGRRIGDLKGAEDIIRQIETKYGIH